LARKTGLLAKYYVAIDLLMLIYGLLWGKAQVGYWPTHFNWHLFLLRGWWSSWQYCPCSIDRVLVPGRFCSV